MNFLLIASLPESLLTFRGALIDALTARNITVHVAAPDLTLSSPLRSQLERKGVVVHDIAMRRTGMNPGADLRTLLSLYRLMRALRPDYVLGYTIKPVVYGLLAAWLARAPRRFALITGLGYAFSEEGRHSPKRRLLQGLAKGLYGIALRTAHKVFFQNGDDQALFKTLGILSPSASSIVVNGSGVDLKLFDVATLPESPHFLLIARLLRDKGVREYARAAQRLHRRYPHARFSLVGWLDDNPDCIDKQELDMWISTGAITYLGRLNDVRPAIEACSVYVLPSYREGTPRTVLEAMAMGRPIVTTDAPGCRETVVHDDNGLLVPVKSVDKLADAMERFIREPTLASAMGRRSRVLAEAKYDVHKINAIMLDEMSIDGPVSHPSETSVSRA